MAGIGKITHFHLLLRKYYFKNSEKNTGAPPDGVDLKLFKKFESGSYSGSQDAIGLFEI